MIDINYCYRSTVSVALLCYEAFIFTIPTSDEIGKPTEASFSQVRAGHHILNTGKKEKYYFIIGIVKY